MLQSQQESQLESKWNRAVLEALPIVWPEEKKMAFCSRWQVEGLWLFGAVLRDDFRPDSDVDLLVEFAADAPWDLLCLVRMQRELREMLGRSVDFLERLSIERSRNLERRDRILSSARRVYGVDIVA